MKKYDLSQIMTRAWQLYRKGVAAFAECLHRAWMAAKAAPINAQRIEESRRPCWRDRGGTHMGRLAQAGF